ncbi:MAG: hypothetical protein RLZZ413_985 [Pseudomonadota bacterium]
MKRTILATAAALALSAGPLSAETVAVITPYLAQPGTQAYVEGFQAKAAEAGWTVNVIDTAGDVAAVISRIEDSVTQKVDAIVINVDPAQVAAGFRLRRMPAFRSSGWMPAPIRCWLPISPPTAMPWRQRRRFMWRTGSAAKAGS